MNGGPGAETMDFNSLWSRLVVVLDLGGEGEDSDLVDLAND